MYLYLHSFSVVAALATAGLLNVGLALGAAPVSPTTATESSCIQVRQRIYPSSFKYLIKILLHKMP
jgi:hypothetical protein